MIVAVTPTGDRLHQFKVCYELMMRQTVKPDRWIIVDDGVQKLQNIVGEKIDNMEIIIVQRDANPDIITLKDNLLAVLDKIAINEKVIFIEDDDYYPATYIEAMSQLLDDYNVVGGLLRKYYNLNYQGYWEFSRPTYGTLSSTGFKADKRALNILRKICSNGDGLKIDIDFWREITSRSISNFLHSDERAQVIGIKGWKVGRKGSVIGAHRKNRRKFVYDKHFKTIIYYFGDFSEKYKSFIERSFLRDSCRAFLGSVFRIRRNLKLFKKISHP